MGDHEEGTGTHGCCCGNEADGEHGQSAGEEGECCGGHGQRPEGADAGGQGCGCGQGAPAESSAADGTGQRGHGGGCCGGHGEPGGHGHHGTRGARRMPTPAERIAMLEQYLKDLKTETQVVEERLTELKAAA
jgi:hypothetical protein